MINLNQLLDQLQPTPDAAQKSTAGLQAPEKEGFIFSDILAGSQKVDEKGNVLDLEGGSLSLEDWVESSLLELSLEQQQALLAALFTLEEGLTAQVSVGELPIKAQAQVDAFWSALEGLLQEWRLLMVQGDLLRSQLNQSLEPDVRRGLVEKLDHLSKLESEGIWDQIIHWVGRFMEKGQTPDKESSFAPLEASSDVIADEVLVENKTDDQGSDEVPEEELKLQDRTTEGEDLEAHPQSKEENLSQELIAAQDVSQLRGQVEETAPKQLEVDKKVPLQVEENQRVGDEPKVKADQGNERNVALQQKILRALQAVANGQDSAKTSLASSSPTLEGIEIQQGDPENMWRRIRRWLADRLVQENVAKVQSNEALSKGPEALSKGGAVEFLKFVATLQRKGFGLASGLEAQQVVAEDLEKKISPEVRRRLPLSTPPVIRQASYGAPLPDLSSNLLQYGDKVMAEFAKEPTTVDGPRSSSEGVGGSKEAQEPQARTEAKGENLSPAKDSSRWDSSFLQRFVNSTRSQFQLWADRKFVAMQVQLEPEALGRMQLKTILENGRIGVLIQVEQNSARDLLNSHLDQLRNILEDKGLEVAAFHVEVRQQQTGGGQGFYGPKTHGPQFDLEALMQDSDGELQVESPILRGLINKVA